MADFAALKNIEPMVGDVYAFRGFSVSSTGDLVGMTYLQPILPGANRARCPHDDSHTAPEVDCTCGFYAFDSEPNTWRSGQLDAVVKLSGKVIVCEDGVRAEIMEIVAISGGNRFIADGMRIPWFEDLSEMLKHFPITQIERPVEEEKEEPENEPVAFVPTLPPPTPFKKHLVEKLQELKSARATMLNFAFGGLFIAFLTVALYFIAGIHDFLLLVPLATALISLQAKDSSHRSSMGIVVLIGLTAVLASQLDVASEEMPGHFAELLVISAAYTGALHLMNAFSFFVRPKASTFSVPPGALLIGGSGKATLGARRLKELAPNPVKTNPSDTEGR